MFGLTDHPLPVGALALLYALTFLCFLLIDWRSKVSDGLNLGLAGLGIMGAAAFFPWQVPDGLRTAEMARSGVILALGFISFGVAFVAYLTTNSLDLSKLSSSGSWRSWIKDGWVADVRRIMHPVLQVLWHLLFGFAGIAWCFGLAQLTVQICLLWQ